MAITKTLDMTLDDAKKTVTEALAKVGFGILTEIDVSGTIKAKIGVERNPMIVLGACNPKMANQALDTDPNFSLLLPCNVVLEKHDNETKVSIADPRDLFSGSDLAPLAGEAADLLTSALEGID